MQAHLATNRVPPVPDSFSLELAVAPTTQHVVLQTTDIHTVSVSLSDPCVVELKGMNSGSVQVPVKNKNGVAVMEDGRQYDVRWMEVSGTKTSRL